MIPAAGGPSRPGIVLHDDGRLYEPELLDQHRLRGRWRVVVRYTVAPGFTFQRGEWADELRPATEPQDDQQYDARRGHRQADGEHHPT